MPVIPRFNQRNFLQTGSPVSIDDSGSARIPGRALAAFGEGVNQLGVGLAEHERRRRQVKNTLDKNEKSALLQEAAIESHDIAAKHKKADGSDYDQIFTDEYDKRSTEILQGVEDPEVLQASQTAGINTRNQIRSKILQESRVLEVNENFKRVEDQKNVSTAKIQSDPNLYEAEVATYGQLLDSLDGSLFSSEQVEKVRSEHKKEAAQAAVNGLVDKGAYQEAKTQLQTRFSDVFDTKQRLALSDRIESEQAQDIELENRKFTRQKLLTTEALKTKRDLTERALFEQIGLAKNDIERELVEKRINAAHVANNLDKPQVNFLKSFLKQENKQDDGKLYIHYVSQIYNSEDLEQIKRQVVKDHEAGSISTQNARSVLDLISRTKKMKVTNPGFTKKVSIDLNQIKNTLTPSKFDRKFEGDAPAFVNEAQAEYAQRLYSGPNDDTTRNKIKTEVIFKYGGGFVEQQESETFINEIPSIVPQDDKKALHGELIRLKNDYKSGKITKTQYDKLSGKIEKRFNYLDLKVRLSPKKEQIK